MSTTCDVKKIAAQAADLLRPGIAKRALRTEVDGEYRYCARGAISQVVTGDHRRFHKMDSDDLRCIQQVEDAIVTHLDPKWYIHSPTLRRDAVADWNNSPDTTTEDVVAVFEAVAA